jgi:hypothetical protein
VEEEILDDLEDEVVNFWQKRRYSRSDKRGGNE